MKGMNTGIIVVLIVMVLSTSLIAAIIESMQERTDDEVQEIEEGLGQFDRSVVLHPTSSEAEDELRSLTLFTKLRAEHCFALSNYLTETPIHDDGLEEGWEESVDRGMEDIRPLRRMDLGEIRNLECYGDDLILDFDNLQEVMEDFESIALREGFCRGVQTAGPYGTVGGAATGGATSGAAAGASIGAVGGPIGASGGALVGGSAGLATGVAAVGIEMLFCGSGDGFEPDSLYVEDSGNDMEGRFGNIAFQYPDTEEETNRPITLEESAFTKRMSIPDSPDDDYRDTDYYWDEKNSYIGMDLQIAGYLAHGEVMDVNELRECENYPMTNYAPYTLNVPVIMTDYGTIEEDDGENFWGVQYDLSDDFGCGEMNDPEWNDYSTTKNFQREYERVICPGTEGRIQANKGRPDNTGEATPSIFDEEEYYHKLYPFIEVMPDSKDCVEEQADRFDGGAAWSRLEFTLGVPLMDKKEEQTTLLELLPEFNLECDSFSDVGEETYNVDSIPSELQNALESTPEEITCGIQTETIGNGEETIEYYRLGWYYN